METLNNWYWSDTILELIIYVSQELYLPILEFCPLHWHQSIRLRFDLRDTFNCFQFR